MKSLVIRLSIFGAAAIALQGCAILGIGGSQQVASAPAAQTSSLESSGRYAATAGPTGLVRCKKVSVTAQDCWRRGDAHTLYPAESPGEVDADSAAFATPTPVKANKKKQR